MFRQLAILCLIGVLSEFLLAEAFQLDVSYHKGFYALNMDMHVSAESDSIHQMLTDYNHLAVINPSIKESELLGATEDGAMLVSTKIKGCVLFFCKTMQRVEKVYDRGNGIIESDMLPEQSDFSFGEAVWRISPEVGGSRINYQAKLKPNFSVPPGIGPVLVKYVMRRELRHTAKALGYAE